MSLLKESGGTVALKNHGHFQDVDMSKARLPILRMYILAVNSLHWVQIFFPWNDHKKLLKVTSYLASLSQLVVSASWYLRQWALLTAHERALKHVALDSEMKPLLYCQTVCNTAASYNVTVYSQKVNGHLDNGYSVESIKVDLRTINDTTYSFNIN